MTVEAKRILVVCSDLMFSGGIRAEGGSQGIVLEFIDSGDKFDEALEKFHVALFMLDLHHHKLGGERADQLVKKLKASEKKQRRVHHCLGQAYRAGTAQIGDASGF